MARVLKNVSKISGIYGQPGEERVSSYLEEALSDEYLILNSPRVSYHGATIDIDHVVIGPNGIFSIESKNMHGRIFGGLMGNWTQERKRSGKNRRVKIGNPANQANHYAKIVKSYLTVKYLNEVGNKVNVKVYPLVVFVHDEADLSEMEYTRNGFIGRVKVLKMDELVDFITTRDGATYSKDDVDNFAELLVPADQRDQTEYFQPGFLAAQKDQLVKRYELYEEIGRGNFGTVYRGFDFKLDREVAVKKMHKRQKDPDAIRRFFREAQINAKLSQENIVAVYDYYEDDGDYFLIMEFIDGETLEDYIHGRSLTIEEVFNITDPICAALENAHANGVVHRDLKPANILLTTEKKVKVSDFGIARLTEDANVTQTSASLGTPAVMAPEQITGKAVDARTDIFGIGVLLYLMLAGVYPFVGEHIGEVVNKILYQEPEPLRSVRPDIPLSVEKLINKCMAKNPEDRFKNMTELREALYASFIAGHGEDSLDLNGKSNLIRRFLHMNIPSFIGNDRRFLSTFILIGLIAIMSLIGYQSFIDSRNAATELQTKQYGFTNENLKALYAEPEKFQGVPINVVGKIGKIINLTPDTTIFNVTVSGENVPYKNLIVEYRQPHFMMQVSEYIKVVGSVQSGKGLNGTDGNTPVIIADKVEAIADPWSILAPTTLTIHPNLSQNRNGKIVSINRVEFADRETRLFVTVANTSKEKAYFVLSKPIGRQDNRIFKEVPNRYGIFSQPTLELNAGEYIEEVIFLEPLNTAERSARFVFGSDLNLADDEKPFVFDLKW